MKRFLAFVKKEFLHIFRDYRTLIILFGIPASQLLIFGFAVSTDINHAATGILDLSKDATSRGISNKLESSGFFDITYTLTSYEEIDKAFKKGKIKEVIVFPENFGNDLISEGSAKLSIIADGSEPNSANLVTNYTLSIINDFTSDMSIHTAPIINTEVRMLFNPGLESHFMFVPGVITLILILICALMTSVTIAREKEFGNMEVLLVSPLKPWQIITGKVAPYFVLSLINVFVILLMAWFVFHLPVQGNTALLIAVCMLYILLGLSLGILISTSVSKMQNAMFISLIGLMLPSLLLSGFIFPIENMPEVYKYVSMLLPPKWFVDIIRSVMIKGAGIQHIWKEILILIVMTAIFIMLSAKKFKIRLSTEDSR